MPLQTALAQPRTGDRSSPHVPLETALAQPRAGDDTHEVRSTAKRPAPCAKCRGQHPCGGRRRRAAAQRAWPLRRARRSGACEAPLFKMSPRLRPLPHPPPAPPRRGARAAGIVAAIVLRATALAAIVLRATALAAIVLRAAALVSGSNRGLPDGARRCGLPRGLPRRPHVAGRAVGVRTYERRRAGGRTYERRRAGGRTYERRRAGGRI